MDHNFEKRALQIAIGLACVVPLAGGLLGVIFGADMLVHVGEVTLNSHVRYLSGLLVGIGLCFASTISRVEKLGSRFTILSALVILGGLARLVGVVIEGWPAPSMGFALLMELGVVPLLWIWQRRLAAKE